MEVVSGIILGLDTDTALTGASLTKFIDRSHIPVLTINLLQALPKTPLWERLAASGRLNSDPQRDSNVVFTRPYREVLDTWRTAIRHAYSPEALFARYEWNLRATYPNRLTPPLTRARLSRRNLRRGATLLAKIVFRIGICGDYRRIFGGSPEGAARRTHGGADRRGAGRASYDPLRARVYRGTARTPRSMPTGQRPSATNARAA